MEIDILNDLLNRCVSNLFTNSQMHISFLTDDEEPENQNNYVKNNEKIFNYNPQKNLTYKQQPGNNNSKQSTMSNQNYFQNFTQKDKNKNTVIENIINNNIQNTNNVNYKENNKRQPETNLNNCTLDQWRANVGRLKFEEALKRLQLDERKIPPKNLSIQTLEFLLKEKGRIKTELKKYDEDFMKIFNSKPQREDKEAMKPLYYYYQTLKGVIAKKSGGQNLGSNEKSQTQPNGPAHKAASTVNPNNLNKNMNIKGNNTVYTNPYKAMTDNPHNNNFSINTNNAQNNPNLNLNTQGVPNNFPQSFLKANSPSNLHQNNRSQNTDLYSITTYSNATNTDNLTQYSNLSSASAVSNFSDYNNIHKKANSSGVRNLNKKEEVKVAKKRALSKEEEKELEKEYIGLKKEQNNLTMMLRKYQNDFQRTNNRKVKWLKDIRPVENEYKKYKSNKERLKEIKETIMENQERTKNNNNI